jgi:ABC-type phosphate transport system auxiliary subunit
MDIIKNQNLWEYLKAGIDNNAKKNITPMQRVVVASMPEAGSISKILNILGLSDNLDLLGSEFSDVLMTDKFFDGELQGKIKSEVERSRENLEEDISKSEVIKNIDKLIKELESKLEVVDKLSAQVAEQGRAAMKGEGKKFEAEDTEPEDEDKDKDKDDGGFSAD